MEKISAVYKIVNEVTNESYIGSSSNVKKRWMEHKRPSTWKRQSNNRLYQDMKKYGIENFRFQILAPVMPEYLKQVEQEFIEILQPTYNSIYAKGRDVERKIKYFQSDKLKEIMRKSRKKYYSQPCYYNSEVLTLRALSMRFRRAGIKHPDVEAKKYLI